MDINSVLHAKRLVKQMSSLLLRKSPNDKLDAGKVRGAHT
jgi:hypothetical protein